VLPSATESDALSTMLLTLGPEGFDRVLQVRPEMRALVAASTERPNELHTKASGFALQL
jgi:thiamine biosynthesis lipoprotein ApbE